MKDEAARLLLLRIHVDQRLAEIGTHPLLWAGTMHAAELLALQLIEVHHVLAQTTPPIEWKAWLHREYRDVPGSVRSLADGITWRYGKKDHGQKFTEELQRMIVELTGVPEKKPPRKKGKKK